MDFKALVLLLDNLKHMSSERRSWKLFELLHHRDHKGLTVLDRIIWKGNELFMEDFFSYIKSNAPQAIPGLLKTANEKGWTVGHAIARYKNVKGIQFFLNFVLSESSLFSQVVTAKSETKWTMGHLIARFQGPEELMCFFDKVKRRPRLLARILEERTDDGRQIGHLIAEYQDPQTLNRFFEMVQKYAPKVLPTMLESTLMEGWHLGYFIAQYRNQQSLENFFNLVMKHVPNSMATTLKAQTDEGWNLGHIIAQYQNPQTLIYYIKLVIQHAPNSLAEILNVKNGGKGILEVAYHQHKSAIGAIAFQLITCGIPLGLKINLQLRQCKDQVIEYISELPLDEQIKAIDAAFNKKTPLGRYFDLKTDFIRRQFGDNYRYILKLHELQDLLQAQPKELEKPSTFASKTYPGLYKPAAELSPAAYAHCTPLALVD